jgi:predicted amidohydrolase YtcJ
VIDVAGATLLPGLMDNHVHLAFDASADLVGSLARIAPRFGACILAV